MGLYMPAKKLQMVHEDLNHIILRPGELHIQMADLKTIGSYIEGSGIDQAWIEADLYSPTTVKQRVIMCKGSRQRTLLRCRPFSHYTKMPFSAVKKVIVL